MNEDQIVKLRDITDIVAEKKHYKKADCLEIGNAILEEILIALSNDKEVKLSKFGRFKTRRESRNVSNFGGEPTLIEDIKISSFSFSQYAKNIIKGLKG